MCHKDQEYDGTSECGRPCPPELNRDCCVDYWLRMVREGYWNAGRHEWTPKGMREMNK